MPKKEIDLDVLATLRREAEEEAPIIKFKGETFQMPIELPFQIVEAIGTLQNTKDDERDLVAGGLVAKIARSLFGTRYQEFLDLEPSTNDVMALVENVGQAYGTSQGESSASGTP